VAALRKPMHALLYDTTTLL